MKAFHWIQLLEYPNPTAPAPAPARPSQKPSHGDISGTKRGIIDPLVSKQPEKILNKKIQKRKRRNIARIAKLPYVAKKSFIERKALL